MPDLSKIGRPSKAAAGGRFYVTPQEVAGGAFRCYLSGSVPPRFITLIRDIRSREILYSRDERTAEAKAASPLPASVPKAKMSSAAKPAAKPKSRGQSPEPTDAQLSIPYFAECYQIQKDNQHKEKWTAGRLCRDTELAMDVNKDEERKYYLRLCKHYGVEPISEDSAYFRRHAARLGKPKVAGSSAAASFLQAESNESAAGAASASAPSEAREGKKSEESQGSSLGPPGPPPGPPPEKSSRLERNQPQLGGQQVPSSCLRGERKNALSRQIRVLSRAPRIQVVSRALRVLALRMLEASQVRRAPVLLRSLNRRAL